MQDFSIASLFPKIFGNTGGNQGNSNFFLVKTDSPPPFFSMASLMGQHTYASSFPQYSGFIYSIGNIDRWQGSYWVLSGQELTGATQVSAWKPSALSVYTFWIPILRVKRPLESSKAECVRTAWAWPLLNLGPSSYKSGLKDHSTALWILSNFVTELPLGKLTLSTHHPE